MPKIIVAGGTGFIGKNLTAYFANKGYEIIILSRKKTTTSQGIKTIYWDGKNTAEWKNCLNNAHAIINLSGRNINCLFTEKNKNEIYSSRINAIKTLTSGIQQLNTPPKYFIQFSSIGYYGNSLTQIFTEKSPPGNDFLSYVCQSLENEFNSTPLLQTKKIIIRCGLVLGKNGGILQPLEKLTRYFLGGTAGKGNQGISWIHSYDLCKIIEYLITHDNTQTVYNAVAPNPVTNKQFMQSLRKIIKRPWVPPAPARLVTLIATYLVKTEPSIILEGNFVCPESLQNEKFEFTFPEIQKALRNLLTE